MIDSGGNGERATPSEYWRTAPGPTVSAASVIEEALALLMPGARHRDTPALFDGRVSQHTVRAWRRGNRGVPRWALDTIASKVKAHVDRQYAIVDRAMRAQIGRGFYHDPQASHLNEWRLKQKAGG